jgi:hypothetical protein
MNVTNIEVSKMGTIKSSESVTLAEALRAQRTTSAAEVHRIAESHPALARYDGVRQDRVAPGAH